MSKNRSMEITVGAFVILGFVLLGFFVFVIGDLQTAFQPRYKLKVLFATANGITDGSPVQYAGVEVGKVERVILVNRPDKPVPVVQLDVVLPQSVQVRSDDEPAISTLGFLGEKFLDIQPGPGAGPVLAAGGELFGEPPVSTEAIMERSNEVLSEFKQALQGLNSLVGDPEARIYLKEALHEARDATRHWKALGERLNMAMSYAEAGEGNLGRLLYDDDLYQRMVLFVDDLRAHPWKLLSRPKRQKTDTEKK